MFQSTPRFVGEGNTSCHRVTPPSTFQSTPRFVGEGNHIASFGFPCVIMFQSTPRFVGEGNR